MRINSSSSHENKHNNIDNNFTVGSIVRVSRFHLPFQLSSRAMIATVDDSNYEVIFENIIPTIPTHTKCLYTVCPNFFFIDKGDACNDNEVEDYNEDEVEDYNDNDWTDYDYHEINNKKDIEEEANVPLIQLSPLLPFEVVKKEDTRESHHDVLILVKEYQQRGNILLNEKYDPTSALFWYEESLRSLTNKSSSVSSSTTEKTDVVKIGCTVLAIRRRNDKHNSGRRRKKNDGMMELIVADVDCIDDDNPSMLDVTFLVGNSGDDIDEEEEEEGTLHLSDVLFVLPEDDEYLFQKCRSMLGVLECLLLLMRYEVKRNKEDSTYQEQLWRVRRKMNRKGNINTKKKIASSRISNNPKYCTTGQAYLNAIIRGCAIVISTSRFLLYRCSQRSRQQQQDSNDIKRNERLIQEVDDIQAILFKTMMIRANGNLHAMLSFSSSVSLSSHSSSPVTTIKQLTPKQRTLQIRSDLSLVFKIQPNHIEANLVAKKLRSFERKMKNTDKRLAKDILGLIQKVSDGGGGKDCKDNNDDGDDSPSDKILSLDASVPNCTKVEFDNNNNISIMTMASNTVTFIVLLTAMIYVLG